MIEDIEKIIIIRDSKGPFIDKVQYICPPHWSSKFPPLAFLVKMALLIKYAKRENPSFIHSFLLYPHGILALIAAKLTGNAVGVSLVAGPIEMYVLGGSPEKKYSYTNSLPSLSRKGKLLLSIVNQFDFITVAGTFTRNFLIKNGISSKKIFFIPYAVTDEKCRPLSITKIYDLIFVGRLVRSKHVEVSLYCVRKIIDEYANRNVKFCIIGDGPCREELERLSKDLGLSNNVDFLGYQNDISNYFNQAKLSIVTSERETGPLTAIESMMCGVPVVSSRCGDTVNDLIRDGVDGYLIDNYEDYNAYADRIAYLLNNEKILLSFSMNARHSPNLYGTDSIADLWKSILHVKK